jgi:hypothetical protein
MIINILTINKKKLLFKNCENRKSYIFFCILINFLFHHGGK